MECELGVADVLFTQPRELSVTCSSAGPARIGRLHEAEDESQEFAALHAAIRAARKDYQTHGTMPDWEGLAQAAEAVRQTGH